MKMQGKMTGKKSGNYGKGKPGGNVKTGKYCS
jgi:hypothetical protein